MAESQDNSDHCRRRLFDPWSGASLGGLQLAFEGSIKKVSKVSVYWPENRQASQANKGEIPLNKGKARLFERQLRGVISAEIILSFR